MVLYSFYIFDRHSKTPVAALEDATDNMTTSRVHLQSSMDTHPPRLRWQ